MLGVLAGTTDTKSEDQFELLAPVPARQVGMSAGSLVLKYLTALGSDQLPVSKSYCRLGSAPLALPSITTARWHLL